LCNKQAKKKWGNWRRVYIPVNDQTRAEEGIVELKPSNLQSCLRQLVETS
jgi:hypothetical protein